MLLRFAVRNFRSISATQEILFTASALSDDVAGLLRAPGLPENVLPVIAIYGANAAGKSSMLLAFEFFRSGILRSHNTTEKFRIGRESFRLGEIPDADTSSFECDFVLSEIQLGKNTHENVRFTYGVVISDEEVREEWLFAYPLNHRRVLFHRNSAETPVFHFGKDLKGNNKVISENTRKDALFLSTANANNHGQLSQIYEYFRRIGIRTSEDSDFTGNLLSSFLENDERRARLLDYLKEADIGICDAEIAPSPLEPGLGPIIDDLESVISKHFPNKNNNAESISLLSEIAKRKKIRLGHSSPDGVVYFDLKDESRGTLAYLKLMTGVILALATGRVLFIDELDSSLHPLLCRKIVELFNSPLTNKLRSQLIFTTHDTTLLSMPGLRRDQFWLVEKDALGASHFYPISDLKLRKTDNLEKGYLQGRFGAVPVLHSFSG